MTVARSSAVHDGEHPLLILEPEGDRHTTVTIHLDRPAMAASMDPSMVEASLTKMNELIEAET